MALRIDLEDRADRRVDLGVHEDDVLAVTERLEDDGRRVLDVAGDLADDIDLLAAAQEVRIVGERGLARPHRVLEARLVVDADGVLARRTRKTCSARSGLRFEAATSRIPGRS